MKLKLMHHDVHGSQLVAEESEEAMMRLNGWYSDDEKPADTPADDADPESELTFTMPMHGQRGRPKKHQ